MPNDSTSGRLMAEIHFYTPFNFTLMRQDENWGNQFYYGGEGLHSTTENTVFDQRVLDAMMEGAGKQ